jgi:KaiC/GvpD/RAD55 family RecA-like ATPase
VTDLDGFDDDDTFGPLPVAPDNVVPFPALRSNARLEELWRAEVDKRNKKNGKRHQFHRPLDVLPELLKDRLLPKMSWPAAWTELARRMPTIPGDCVGIVGAIGGGKTSFAIQCGLAHRGDGMPVIWVPLELDEQQIISRIAANMSAVHALAVRDHWSAERLAHVLSTIHDMWIFVDRYYDADEQMAAIRDAVDTVWAVYRLPPQLIVDHLGELVAGERDERLALINRAQQFRAMMKETKSFGVLLAQTSKANQAVMTGKVDTDSATDMLGIEAGSTALSSVCANTVALTVFKQDDAAALDAIAQVSKSRHGGGEGKVGMRFSKPGGVWSELGYKPSTPTEVAAEAARDKKNKAMPAPRELQQVRADLNAARAGDANAARRVAIHAALVRHGALGMQVQEIRKIPGAGRGPTTQQALQELERAGDAQRIPGNKWRAVPRTHE